MAPDSRKVQAGMEESVMLVFILDKGAFIQVYMTRSEAKQFVQNWLSGQDRLMGKQRVGGNMNGVSWAVDMEHVVAMHTMEIDQVSKPRTPLVPPIFRS